MTRFNHSVLTMVKVSHDMIPWSLLNPKFNGSDESKLGGYCPTPVRYARWDGGPLEVAKAQLSGWLYMQDPMAVEATCQWYEGDQGIELLRQAEINWIWVTFSVGFSRRTEQRQWQILEPFIQKCHAAGIKVTAYMSMTNMFIDDVRAEHPDVDQWMQYDIGGKPIPYGAVEKYLGEAPTRILGCLSAKPWQQFLLERVDAALAQQVDGMVYDNMAAACRCEHCARR